MKKLSVLFAAFMMAIVFSGCEKEKETIEEAYSFGIHNMSTNISDFGKISSYLKLKGCLMDYKIYSGADKNATDRQAKAEFEVQVKKISKAEIDGLGLSSGAEFTYAVVRNEDSTSPDSKSVTIAEFQYRQVAK